MCMACFVNQQHASLQAAIKAAKAKEGGADPMANAKTLLENARAVLAEHGFTLTPPADDQPRIVRTVIEIAAIIDAAIR